MPPLAAAPVHIKETLLTHHIPSFTVFLTRHSSSRKCRGGGCGTGSGLTGLCHTTAAGWTTVHRLQDTTLNSSH